MESAVLKILLLCFVLEIGGIRAQNTTQDICNLSDSEVSSLLSPEDRTWVITDEAIAAYGLQFLVACAEPEDTILLKTSEVLIPSEPIEISRQITIKAADRQVIRLSCPERGSLFRIKSSVNFGDLEISDCDLKEEDDVFAVIEVDSCAQLLLPGIIQLSRVHFRRNRNLGGSAGLSFRDPACYKLKMDDVTFESNEATKKSVISFNNELANVRLVDNKVLGGDTEGGGSRRTLLQSLIDTLRKRREAFELSSFNSSTSLDEFSTSFDSGESELKESGKEAYSTDLSPFLFLPPGSLAKIESLTAENNVGILISADSSEIELISVNLTGNLNSEGVLISTNNSVIRVSKSNFISNDVSHGVIGSVSTDIAINSSTFRSNSGRAAVIVLPTSLNIVDSIFESNNGTDPGGALCVKSDNTDKGSLFITRCRFQGNEAQQGGALYADAPLTLTDCFFLRNKAEQSGGAIATGPSDSDIEIRNTRITRNKANLGGGLYIDNTHRVELIEVQVSHNEAVFHGGGLFVDIDDLSDGHFITGCNFTHNQAQVGGGAFLKNNLANKIFRAVGSRQTTTLANTVFVSNHAEIAGGGYFVDELKFLSPDCDLEQVREITAKSGALRDNVKCTSVHSNSVGKFGYASNVATNAVGFYLEVIGKKKITTRVMVGDTYSISSWRGGDILPDFVAVMVDSFGQGPALSRGRQVQESNGLLMFDGSVDAFAESPDGLISCPLEADVSSGIGTFSLGAPLKEPGTYSLEFWFGESSKSNVTVYVTFRECQINEETTSTASGILWCDECDAKHFNFYPELKCRDCPENCECSEWGVSSKEGYWMPSPCFTNAWRCLSNDACEYDHRDYYIKNFFASTNKTCNLTSFDLSRFCRIQCKEGYEGPLCGSCSEGYGKLDLDCAQCIEKVNIYLYLTARLVWIIIIVTVSIAGNLGEINAAANAENDIFHESMPRLASSSEEGGVANERSVPLIEESGSSQVVDEETVDVSKRRVNESIKILLNFAQVNSTAVGINARWTYLIRKFLDGLNFLGAVNVEEAVSLDCLFGNDSAVPRAIVRSIVTNLMPIAVFILGMCYWRGSIRSNPELLKRRLILSAVVVLYISYIGWAENLSYGLNCVHIDQGATESEKETGYYWVVDTSVKCYEGSHAVYAGFLVVPMIALILIGFPILSIMFLHHIRRQGLLRSTQVRETVGFMYRAYTDDCVYWECVVLVRKAALGLVVVFGASLGSNMQGLTAVCILVFCLFLQSRFLPFRDEFREFNSLEIFSLLVTIFTYIGGLYLNDSEITQRGRLAVSVMAALLILVFLAYTVANIWGMVKDFFRKSLLFDRVSLRGGESLPQLVRLWIHNRSDKIIKTVGGSRRNANGSNKDQSQRQN